MRGPPCAPAAPRDAHAGHTANSRAPCSRSAAFCASAARPCRESQSIAAPSPIAPAMSGVPASNLCGTRLRRPLERHRADHVAAASATAASLRAAPPAPERRRRPSARRSCARRRRRSRSRAPARRPAGAPPPARRRRATGRPRSRAGADLRDRQHRAERVRHVGDRDELSCAAASSARGARAGRRRRRSSADAQRRARARTEHLPRHDVRVVLELGDDDLVAGPTCARP